MDSFYFQYPSWWLIVCALGALSLAALLYYKSPHLKERAKTLNPLLGILRFATLFLIAGLLLAPFLKSFFTEVKKPVIIIAQDDSESLQRTADSISLSASFGSLVTALEEDFEVETFTFGQEVRPGLNFSFQDKTTNLSSLFSHISDQYVNQNVGAIVLASDGIYNEGNNPVFSASDLNAPVYTIALGDTTEKRDLKIRKIFHNQIAYLGDQFEVEVDVSAFNTKNQNAQLIVSKYKSGAYSEINRFRVQIDSDDFFTTQRVILDADVAGVEQYKFELTRLGDEVSYVNNQQEIFIEVLDARQKILILAQSPHPDIAALKSGIEINKNYEVEYSLSSKFNGNIQDFDLVILHQLPGNSEDAQNFISEIKNRQVPVWYIIGGQSDIRKIAQAQDLVSITGDGRSMNDVSGKYDPDFDLFTFDEQKAQSLSVFAPLSAPFGEYSTDNQSQVLLNQRIGRVDTEYPLLVFRKINNRKEAVLTAEGIWKWKLYDFLENGNHQIFNELIGKSIQYLTIKEDKRKFRVVINDKIFNENEPVSFDALLYNDSYELVNEPEVNMVIKDKNRNDYTYTFSKKSDSYTLNAGLLPVGNYTYTGTTSYLGQTLRYDGKFSVRPIQKELFETTANHSLLFQLSDRFGGQLIYPNAIASLADIIKSSEAAKPVMYQTAKTTSVINIKWIFALLALLLVVEWFIRRYFGSY